MDVKAAIRRVAVLVGLVLALSCVLTDRPARLPVGLFLSLVVAALAIWTAAVLLPARLVAARAVAFVVFGVCGGLLDLVQPWGPGFVAGFLAVAALGLSLPLRPAAALAVPVLIVVGAAEAATSDHPANSLLNVGLGLAFFFAASSYAATNREASDRAARLLESQTQTRQAQDRAAALAERARLARELHDVLAHTLSGLNLQLEAARLLALRSGADPQVLQQIELAQRSARTGVADGKRAIAALRGRPLSGTADLPALVADFQRDSGIRCAFTEAGAPEPLSPESSLALYRAAQESLSNVRRHARSAQRVRVELCWEPGRVALRVTDDGAGPAVDSPVDPAVDPLVDPAVATGDALVPGFGLSGLAERAAILGGTFTAGAGTNGFTTTITLPTTVATQEVS